MLLLLVGCVTAVLVANITCRCCCPPPSPPDRRQRAVTTRYYMYSPHNNNILRPIHQFCNVMYSGFHHRSSNQQSINQSFLLIPVYSPYYNTLEIRPTTKQHTRQKTNTKQPYYCVIYHKRPIHFILFNDSPSHGNKPPYIGQINKLEISSSFIIHHHHPNTTLLLRKHPLTTAVPASVQTIRNAKKDEVKNKTKNATHTYTKHAYVQYTRTHTFSLFPPRCLSFVSLFLSNSRQKQT